MKVWLSSNLGVDVWLSNNLGGDVWLSSDLGVDVWLSLDLGVDILHSWDLLMDVGLSNRVDLSSIIVWVDGGIGNWGKSWGSKGWGSNSWGSSSNSGDCWGGSNSGEGWSVSIGQAMGGIAGIAIIAQGVSQDLGLSLSLSRGTSNKGRENSNK